MNHDTTPQPVDPAEVNEMMSLLRSINPYQLEQFEAVFAMLVKAKLGHEVPSDLFARSKSKYQDMMVEMSFQLWVNAKLNHMKDMERRAEEVREMLMDPPDGATKH